MLIDKDEPICCYFENLSRFDGEILHFVSTRRFLKDQQFSISFNGSLSKDRVRVNRKVLFSKFGLDVSSSVFTTQVHGNKVERVSIKEKGRGVNEVLKTCLGSDGMITQHQEICLVIQMADCVPLLFFDPIKKVIATAHAGWRGTVMKIGAKVIEEFRNVYDSDPADILAGIGPSIGPCCYEVGNEVISKVEEAFRDTKGILLNHPKFSRPVFDLWEANRRILIEKGINPRNIEMANLCTRCHSDMFFSARAGDEGRFGSFIMLK